MTSLEQRFIARAPFREDEAERGFALSTESVAEPFDPLSQRGFVVE